jgi:hypothetical protein
MGRNLVGSCGSLAAIGLACLQRTRAIGDPGGGARKRRRKFSSRERHTL